MKKTILLLAIAFTFCALTKAQQPTKEQTIQFINKSLADIGTDNLWCSSERYDFRKASLEKIEGKVLLLSTYTHDGYYLEDKLMQPYDPEAYDYKIDLSKVEEIRIVYGAGFVENGRGCRQVGLWFVEEGQQKALMHLPLWVYGYNVNLTYEQTAKNEKIYKAFNRLRKLCGAPEPLKFD
ncbi:hypothetical protein [Mariniflexile sp.]|uniref:hypothetical protein n=1 Tax=Mariniflexile sp. TaxID=1979402 RepID=UPI0040474A13